MHDWMHALFDGVLHMVVYLCFETFIKAGQVGIYESFSAYVSNWKWPRRLHADHLSEIFTRERRDKHRNAKHIKCQASDMLSLVGVLALYVQTVLIALNLEHASCRASTCAMPVAITNARNCINRRVLGLRSSVFGLRS